MDSESGEIAPNFQPQLGGLGDDICTMACPALHDSPFTECNSQPAAQASSILTACGSTKLKMWPDTTSKFPAHSDYAKVLSSKTKASKGGRERSNEQDMDISHIPQAHIDKLKQDGSLASQFDRTYGEGAAAACTQPMKAIKPASFSDSEEALEDESEANSNPNPNPNPNSNWRLQKMNQRRRRRSQRLRRETKPNPNPNPNGRSQRLRKETKRRLSRIQSQGYSRQGVEGQLQTRYSQVPVGFRTPALVGQ